MDTPAELVRLLMRIGYWAVWHGLYAEAATLFTGARAARPQSEVPVLGMAVLSMAMQKPDAAVELLRETAAPLNPRSELVQAHLGCALRLAGQEAAGLELLGRISRQATDSGAREMSLNLLGLTGDQLRPQLARVL